MNNYVNAGKTLNYTAGAEITSGQVVVVGNLLTVAAVSLAIGETGTLATEGVFDLPKVDAAVIGQGQMLTWDVSALDGAGAFDDDQAVPANGDITGPCAVAMESRGATVGGTIRVKLTGVPGTVKTGGT